MEWNGNYSVHIMGLKMRNVGGFYGNFHVNLKALKEL